MREIIPLSIPALINQLDVPALGLFEDEVKSYHIREARVVLIDIHWYLSLPGALKLARRLKKVNPHLSIIAGGLTATTYAQQIVSKTDIDFIIRGDTEEPLRRLVNALLEGGSVEEIPNLVHKDFISSWSYRITREEFDALNYLDYDFFPTFKKKVYQYHSRKGNRILPIHPFALPFKGCPLACDHCIGSPAEQKNYFNRGVVIRSAEVLQAELEQISNDPGLTMVNMFWDVLGLLPASYSRKVFNKNYDVRLYYEAAAEPREDSLDFLLNSFKGGTIAFSIDEFHTTSTTLRNLDRLIEDIRTVDKKEGFISQLEYSATYLRESESYGQAIADVKKHTNAILKDASFWWKSIPNISIAGPEKEKQFWHFADNKAFRFRTLNFVYKTGLLVHRFFPAITEWFAQKLYAWGDFTKGPLNNSKRSA